ncbi:MAG TPA: LysM peptidoglycan-binding domain-containing protein [Vicinamibacterales bacterium]|jgi:membrane-bound lytic murein transglycosylase D
MISRTWLSMLAAAGLVFVAAASAGCGSNPKPQTPAPPPAPAPVAPAPAPPPPSDPIATLIATSQQHFLAGERELKLGHLNKARMEFDRAVEVLLESPYGARTEPRLREHFDRLVDRINAHEVVALAQGDGFVEKKYEPASIDELLKIATFPKPAADAATEKAVKDDLAATEHDVPIPQNERVLAYVELFQGRLRDYIHESLTRGTKYLPMIQGVFKEAGLPLDLAYIPVIESGFKTNALSVKSAKGPWQFMRATATEQGLKTDWYIDERSDPEKATVAAAKYLKLLYDMFDGDWHLVLAAYNGGLGRVQRAMKRSGRTDFWSLSSTSRYLPRETREYVPLILAAIIVAKNPAQYGFEVHAEDPIAYDTVTVPRAIDLRRVAEWTGCSIDEIQSLNPELRRWTTPLKSEYELRVPKGTGETLTVRLASASPSELVALTWYTVRKGESLATIARKLQVSRLDLAEANHLSTKSKVKTGQSLVVPRAPTTLLATNTRPQAPAEVASKPIAGSAPLATEQPRPAVAASKSPAATRVASASTVKTVTYRVKQGDTLFGIAQLFDTTVAKIKSLNRLRSNRITPGTRLKIATAT